ncbi:nucleotidyltransferase family protein [Shewanella sp. A14]
MLKLKPNIVTVILAAGASSRFNGSKITAKVQGGNTLLAHSIATLNQVTTVAGITAPAVVLGAHLNDEVMAITAVIHRIINHDWSLGLSSSVKHAAQYAVDQNADALLLALADQVAIPADDYARLIDAYCHNGQTSCAFYQQSLGVPAIFLAEDFAALMSIEGDKGAKSILKRHDKNNSLNILNMEQGQFDIDTPADLARWLDQMN